jgi:predicted ATP-grasp superfamily ATP-dependent carboligase
VTQRSVAVPRLPSVAVFDSNHPPAVAFIRSLGMAGVPVTVYTRSRLDAGRYSKFAAHVRQSPDPLDSDVFVAWLVGEIESDAIELVAPTSDAIAFAIAEAADQLPPGRLSWSPAPEAVRTCLFKLDFSRAMECIGFPTPVTCAPMDLAEAERAADLLGYPAVVKPRSHVGLGDYRGGIVHDREQLRKEFVVGKYRNDPALALAHDSTLTTPLLQQFMPLDRCDVISLSGCLGREGELLSIGICRKLDQWPPGVGIGTLFESMPEQPYMERAVELVRRTLGSGLFELELLVDRVTGEAWPIDLNPRAYGQISLEIARGNDLPLHWYRAATGLDVATTRPATRVMPRYWRQGVQYFTGELVQLVNGPKRVGRLRRLYHHLRYPSVGAIMAWYDLGPAVVFVLLGLRHPGGLIRPFLRSAGERSERIDTRR